MPVCTLDSGLSAWSGGPSLKFHPDLTTSSFDTKLSMPPGFLSGPQLSVCSSHSWPWSLSTLPPSRLVAHLSTTDLSNGGL